MKTDAAPKLIQITSIQPEVESKFIKLGLDYLLEVDPEHSKEEHEAFLSSMLSLQTQPDRWLIVLTLGDDYAGFIHAKIDRKERLGLGYILEFYIAPQYRLMGLGRMLCSNMLESFQSCGVTDVWLTSHPLAEGFWRSVGFHETGELDGGYKVMIIQNLC